MIETITRDEVKQRVLVEDEERSRGVVDEKRRALPSVFCGGAFFSFWGRSSLFPLHATYSRWHVIHGPLWLDLHLNKRVYA
jgi:hypothetical protein